MFRKVKTKYGQTYGNRKISLRKRHKKMRGYNSFKYSVHKGRDYGVNTLDLKGVSLNQTKDLLIKYIKYCVKNKDLPISVITHNIVDKIVMLKSVIENLKDVEWVVLDFSNCGSFTIVPSGSFSKNKK